MVAGDINHKEHKDHKEAEFQIVDRKLQIVKSSWFCLSHSTILNLKS
jgi:hypothetical protein